ncbi:DUF945 family protein [Gilliamella apis]|uniref:DUF945 family protein n=1 Tax=Gilliamella apis TaxID=1970738 RepID=UPI00080EB956|nr:DUF945 family protein [Gilliamella apis]OCG05945.1 hypothetical protein A9G19_01150 [Gilliamella apis]
MKKSTLAIGVIAILGLGYVGIAWHTGNVIENELDNTLYNITKQVNNLQNGFKIKIAHSNDEKGIFSTKTHIKIIGRPAGIFDPITLYDDDIIIHHGPFPLAALKQGTFSPQMAWLEYQSTQQSNPDLWKLVGNQPFVNGHINLSYSDNLTINMTTQPIVLSDEDLIFQFLEGKLELGQINYKVSGNLSYETPSVSIVIDNLNYKRHDGDEIKLKNLKVNNKIDDQNYSFEAHNSIDDLFINLKDYTNKQTIELKNFVMGYKLANKTTGLEGDMEIAVDAVNYGKQQMGNGTLELNVQGLDKSFIDNSTQISWLLDSVDSSNITNTKINFKKVHWHNASGDFNFNALIDVDNLNQMTIYDQDIDKVNQFSMNLEAPFAVIARFMSQIEAPESEQITDNQLQKTNNNLQLMAQMALSTSPLVNFKKGNTSGIFSELDYSKSKDQVTINGNKISKQEFLNNLNF